MIEITAVRLVGGGGHEHITDVRWRSASTVAGESTTEAIVDWLSASRHNQAVVVSGAARLSVAVVLRRDRAPHLRACADGAWTDDLLALPVF
jgi:uncharacterized protein DUF3892